MPHLDFEIFNCFNIFSDFLFSPPTCLSRANNDYLADVIKPTAPQSPIEKLPNYNLRKYSPPARRDNEESFNIGISPVKRDPFKTFNRYNISLCCVIIGLNQIFWVYVMY